MSTCYFLSLLISLYLQRSKYAFLIMKRHVHGFLAEIGQGVQHIASRVDNIISFVQEANDRRKVFGEVRTRLLFLDVPQSTYYLHSLEYCYSFLFLQKLCICLGLYFLKYTSQLLRCLDEGNAYERRRQYQESLEQQKR